MLFMKKHIIHLNYVWCIILYLSKIRCEPKILNLNVIEEMKKFSVILLLIIVPFLLDAQDTIKKNGISFKALVMDYQSQNGGNISNFKDYQHGYEIGYQRSLSDKVVLALPARYGVVNSDSINNFKKRIGNNYWERLLCK